VVESAGWGLGDGGALDRMRLQDLIGGMAFSVQTRFDSFRTRTGDWGAIVILVRRRWAQIGSKSTNAY
jgi:hypothetical protein